MSPTIILEDEPDEDNARATPKTMAITMVGKASLIAFRDSQTTS
jgi:hypothetical protein